MTSEDLIVGKFNSFAVNALNAVFKESKTNFPLLIIHGNPGTGKSYLIKEMRKLIPENVSSKYLTATQLVDNFVTSLKQNTHQELRKELIEIDILLIDDFQDIAGRTGTQNELYHIITNRVSNNKQTVLTTSKNIYEINEISEKLKIYLKPELNICISQPNFEERFSIAKKMAIKHQLSDCDDLALSIAETDSKSIREIEYSILKINLLKNIMKNNHSSNI